MLNDLSGYTGFYGGNKIKGKAFGVTTSHGLSKASN